MARKRRRRTHRWSPWLRAAGIAVLVLLVCSVLLVLPLRWIAPSTTSVMLQERLGIGALEARSIHYEWMDWERISPHAAIAFVAAEDQKFPHHGGFDVDSIADALGNRQRRLRGASTISQQVAKNLFLWNERSFVRKGLEAYLTVWIELLWPKRRILEVYLNVAELGPGVYGVGAASERFFGKSAARLTLREAALLAAVLPNPKRMSAVRPSSYVRSRADWIERAALRLGGARYLGGL